MGNCELGELQKAQAFGTKRTEFPVALGSVSLVTEGIGETSEIANR